MPRFWEDFRKNFGQRLQIDVVFAAIVAAVLILGTLGYWGVSTMSASLSKSASSTQALDDLRELNVAVQEVLANPLQARFNDIEDQVAKLHTSLDAMYDEETGDPRKFRRAIEIAKASALVIVRDLKVVRDNAAGASARTAELQALASEFDAIASTAIRDLAEAALAETDALEVSIGPLARTASLIEGTVAIRDRLDEIAAAVNDPDALERLVRRTTDTNVRAAGRLRFKVDKAHRPVVAALASALTDLQQRLEAAKLGEAASGEAASG